MIFASFQALGNVRVERDKLITWVRAGKMSLMISLRMLVSILSKPVDLEFWSSGVRALPVAAGTNEGGHYFWYSSSLVLTVVAKKA